MIGMFVCSACKIEMFVYIEMLFVYSLIYKKYV